MKTSIFCAALRWSGWAFHSLGVQSRRVGQSWWGAWFWGLEGWTEGACRGLRTAEFHQVLGGMNALVGEEGDLGFHSEWDREQCRGLRVGVIWSHLRTLIRILARLAKGWTTSDRTTIPWNLPFPRFKGTVQLGISFTGGFCSPSMSFLFWFSFIYLAIWITVGQTPTWFKRQKIHL